jgi:hypothetical protein
MKPVGNHALMGFAPWGLIGISMPGLFWKPLDNKNVCAINKFASRI